MIKIHSFGNLKLSSCLLLGITWIAQCNNAIAKWIPAKMSFAMALPPRERREK